MNKNAFYCRAGIIIALGIACASPSLARVLSHTYTRMGVVARALHAGAEVRYEGRSGSVKEGDTLVIFDASYTLENPFSFNTIRYPARRVIARLIVTNVTRVGAQTNGGKAAIIAHARIADALYLGYITKDAAVFKEGALVEDAILGETNIAPNTIAELLRVTKTNVVTNERAPLDKAHVGGDSRSATNTASGDTALEDGDDAQTNTSAMTNVSITNGGTNVSITNEGTNVSITNEGTNEQGDTNTQGEPAGTNEHPDDEKSYEEILKDRWLDGRAPRPSLFWNLANADGSVGYAGVYRVAGSKNSFLDNFLAGKYRVPLLYVARKRRLGVETCSCTGDGCNEMKGCLYVT